MHDPIFDLKIQSPFIHTAANAPDVFQPQIFYHYVAVWGHLVAEDEILGMQHVGAFANLTLITVKVRNIKAWSCRAIERLYF